MDKVSSICTSAMIVLAMMAERWSAVEAYRDAFEMLASATQTMLAEQMSILNPIVNGHMLAPLDTTNMAATGNVMTGPQQPRGPVISSGGYDQFTEYLAYMSEVGMCSSVEELLSSMVE